MDETVKRYYSINKKMKEYQDELKFLKARIEDFMEREQVDNFVIEDYTIEKRSMRMQRLTKALCPTEIWNKYATTQEVDAIHVRRKGDKRSRRSREK
jgi:hypothetical protein